MHCDAALRVRELTQNIYDIGDEVAEYIDHVAEAMADWDSELVADCLEELADIVAQGRAEVRPGLAEVNGLRQAFISGVRAGEMSNTFPHPGRTLAFLKAEGPAAFGAASAVGGGLAAARAETDPQAATAGAPSSASAAAADAALPPHALATKPAMSSTAVWRLWLRTHAEELTAQLADLADWVVEQTHLAVETQSVLLPHSLLRAQQATEDIVAQWRGLVACQPALAAAMRGEAPPRFLNERARVEAIAARVRRSQSQAG